MIFILLLMRLILGGIFIYSGFSKLTAPLENFITAIEGYQFLRPELVRPIAFFLPWLELIFGAFLLTGFLTRSSAVVLALFSAVFISLLTRSLILKLPITECGCFGARISFTPHQALFLDSGLFLMAVCLIIIPSTIFSLDKRLQK